MFMIFGGNTGAPQPFGTTSVLSYIRQLVESNTVPMSRLDDAVRRILAVKCEMGLFDTTGVIDTAATARVGSAAHRMVARQAVQKSMVVLKNTNNVLPLSKTATVALAGNSAQNTGNQCGGWTITWQGATGDVIPGATSVRTAMEAAVTAPRVLYSVDGANRTGATVAVVVIADRTLVAPGMTSPVAPCQVMVQPPHWLPVFSALLPASATVAVFASGSTLSSFFSTTSDFCTAAPRHHPVRGRTDRAVTADRSRRSCRTGPSRTSRPGCGGRRRRGATAARCRSRPARGCR